MADPVVFDAALETIDAFNARVGAFCADPETPVVNVLASLVGHRLMLSLGAPSDYPVPLPQAMQPVVGALTQAQCGNLEEELITLRNRAIETLTKPNAAVPIIMQIQVLSVSPGEQKDGIAAYALVVAVIGEVTFAEDTMPAGATPDGE